MKNEVCKIDFILNFNEFINHLKKQLMLLKLIMNLSNI